jgi:putative ABC transport system permease protein
MPGVSAAGYVNYAPLTSETGRQLVTVEGQPVPEGKDLARNIAFDRIVSTSYLSALGVALIRGRLFDERDAPAATRTVVVNETMARLIWPGQDPLGRRFKLGPADLKTSPWITVIGVVGDVRQMGLDLPAEPEFYLPLAQTSFAGSISFFWPRYLVVRTRSDPMTLAAAVRRAVWSVDADQPVSNIRPITEAFAEELSSRNTQLTLVGGLAVLALLLASVGLYGVLSYVVAQRTSEIGLRMALGARRGKVIGSVVRSALVLASLGVLAGTGGALVLSRLLSAFLYGVSPRDSVTFVGVPALLVLVTLVATYVPARRAAGVDPVSALRIE